jgi:hypothetical protein
LAARQPDPVKDLYERWSQTFAERGELPLDEWRHTFQIGAGRLPEADEAIRRLADWARPRLGL